MKILPKIKFLNKIAHLFFFYFYYYLLLILLLKCSKSFI